MRSLGATRVIDISDQVTYDFAHNLQQPLIDATDWHNGTGPLRYAATGEPYTPTWARSRRSMGDFRE